MTSLQKLTSRLGILVLMFFSLVPHSHAQTYSFVGLNWGDSYETVSGKLTAAGFSPLLELVINQREPATQAVRMRMFQEGTLLGQSTRGMVWLENGRLIGVNVFIDSSHVKWEKLFDDALSILQVRYGRQNMSFPQRKADWGDSGGEALSLSYDEKLPAVSILYKSTRFGQLQVQGAKQEASKF